MFRPEIVHSLKSYDKAHFMHDVFAGVTVGFVALPLAMAFAIASGLPPERGLFTAIVAGFLISALGGSKVQIGGPTGAFIVIVAGIASTHGYVGLVWSMLLAGGLLIALGLARMGALIKFIPLPVVTGFTSGIAVVIFSTQIKDLLGLRMEEVPVEFVDKWVEYLVYFRTIDPATAAVGIGTIAVIVLVRRMAPRLPSMLIAMVVATAAVALFKLDVETIGGRFGELPRALPSPSLVPLSFTQIQALVPAAFTVGILAAIESLLSATVADGMIGSKHKPNVELVAQGVANIGAAFLGGIPATGAIARTATNVKSGARTPVAGIIHAITLAALLFLAAPLAAGIPLAALAGILVLVSYNMSEIEHFRSLLRAPRSDVMVLLSTFALTILVDLTVAVEVGIVLAALLFIRRMSEVSNVGIITRELRGDEDESADPNSIETRDVPPGVEVFEIQGPFFFGAAERFQEIIRRIEKPVPVVILRLRDVPAIDATGLHVLRTFHQQCRRDGAVLILSGVHAQPLFALQRSGLWDEIGSDNILGNIDDSLNVARRHLGLPAVSRPVPFVPTVRREAGNTDSAASPDL
ncbi:MAG: sulfate permease [candidate division Zixibacteria bacterium]|jgi:SulP family sulfate permease|nr:sulfate permease [candidate division Zixibacteria bacterium]